MSGSLQRACVIIRRASAKTTIMTRPIRFVSSILFACALVSGCVVGPEYERPEVDLNAEWDETAASEYLEAVPPTPTGWWEIFDDPLLNELVEEAQKQNLDAEIAGLRILEARAALGIALGNRWPQQQDLVGGVTRNQLSNNQPNFFPFADDTFSAANLGFDVNWELDFWGRFRRGIETSEFDLATSLAAYDATLVSVSAETARVYITIRALQELEKVTRNNAALQKRSLEIADVLARNERVTDLDVEQARTLFESTSAEVPLIQGRLTQAKNALSFLLGQPPGRLDARLGDAVVPEVPDKVGVGVPAELLRRRPDVRVAEFRAAAQTAVVGIAEADKYPRFGLTGSLGVLTSDTGDSSLGDLFSSDSVEYTVGPVFSWPILNYGRIDNAVRVQDARLQQLLVDYQNTVLNAAREVEDAIAGYLRERDALESYERSAQAARRSVDIALLQYRESIADYQRVLDTQRVLNSQQQLYVASKQQAATNLVLLYKALGGGWETRVNDPVVDQSTLEQMGERTNWGKLLDPAEIPDREAIQAGGE